MIIADRSDCIEFSQIIFIWCIISMPGHNIEWTAIFSILEELTTKLRNDFPLSIFLIFIPTHWSLEVHWVCQTIGADWSEIGQYELSFEGLTDEPSRLQAIFFKLEVLVLEPSKVNSELDSSLDDTYFKWFNDHATKFSCDEKGSNLWDDEHISIG